MAAGCPHLSHLNIDDCSVLTDVSVYALAAHCTQLVDLSLSFNENITDASLIALAHAAAAHTLQAVHLRWCELLIGACVREFSLYCPLLHTLSVPVRRENNEDVLEHVKLAIPHLKRVRKLDISYHRVDDSVLQLIADHMPELVDLDIGHDTGDVTTYTSIGLSAIALQCEKLQVLNLCSSREDASKLAETLWKQLRPGLQIRHCS